MDVTEQKETREKLKTSKEEYRRLIQTVPHGIAEIDNIGTIILANAAYHKQHGYEEGELSGMSILDLAATDTERVKLRQYLRYLLKEQPLPTPYIGQQRTKTGSVMDIQLDWDYRRNEQEYGRVMGFTTVITDITEQKQAVAALRTSEERYRVLVDTMTEGLGAQDEHGVIQYVNNRLCDIFGYSRQDMIGKPIIDFVGESNLQRWKELMSVRRRGDANHYEAEIPHKDGTITHVLVSPQILRDEEGRYRGSFGVFTDLTEHKQAEQELAIYREHLEAIIAERTANLDRAEKELKDFAYIVSHDLRSPLVSIQGFAGELEQSLDVLRVAAEAGLPALDGTLQLAVREELNELIPEALHFIEAGINKMEGLVSAILQLSRMGRREMHYEPVDIGQLVAANLKAQAFAIESTDITVKTAELPTIITDRLAVGQIFGNLLSNAIKYLVPHRPGVIEVSAESSEKTTRFHVRDNGSGIAKEDIPRVFEIFQRCGKRDRQGEGMGLTYVETLVRRLGGQIKCESELGSGTTFSFILPRKES